MFFILRDSFSLSICEILIFTYINDIFQAEPAISFSRAQIPFGSFVGNQFVPNTYSCLPQNSLEKREGYS